MRRKELSKYQSKSCHVRFTKYSKIYADISNNRANVCHCVEQWILAINPKKGEKIPTECSDTKLKEKGKRWSNWKKKKTVSFHIFASYIYIGLNRKKKKNQQLWKDNNGDYNHNKSMENKILAHQKFPSSTLYNWKHHSDNIQILKRTLELKCFNDRQTLKGQGKTIIFKLN